MSAKTVALDPEAYERLRRHRREGETFSDAVKRLTARRSSILDFAGIWKEIPDAEVERIRAYLEAGRCRDRERARRPLRTEA